MEKQQPDVLRILRRIVWSWKFPAVLSAVLIVALGWWLMPRRMHQVVTEDGTSWQGNAAPPRRQVVWEPAEPVEMPLDERDLDGSLLRPQLAEGGSALYFALRRESGGTDIHVARLVEGRWTPPEPVPGLNSPVDDIGPVISRDGRQLYLYSNRPGGQGGFDLYVARRDAAGWSAPENLGPLVNSPADEYDPALSPDGATLFFSSNRTVEVQRQIEALAAGETDAQEAEKEWDATLRARATGPVFDLYAARRADVEALWEAPRVLEGVNHAAANDGSPFVSPTGSFLYFASDRPQRGGEERNYDIFRARILAGELRHLENLGSGVNSAANEVEPSLSPEGFRLLFSSNRGPQADEYGLYSSTAKEVFEEVYWDDSRLRAVIVSGLWWKALLIALLFALIVAILWLGHGWLFEKASALRFFFASLLVNCLALLLLLLMPLKEAFVEMMEELEVTVASEQLLDENQHQSHEAGQEAWEKFADVQGVEEVAPTEVQRQITSRPNVPSEKPSQVVRLPARFSETRAPDEPVAVQRTEPATQRTSLELGRRSLTRPATPAAPAALAEEQVQPQDAPSESEVTTEVAVNRSPTGSAPNRVVNPLERSVPKLQAAKPAAAADLQPAEMEAPESPKVASLALESRRPQIQAPVAEPAAMEEVPAAKESDAPQEAPLANVTANVDRREAAVQQPGAPRAERPTQATDLPRAASRIDPSRAADDQAVVPVATRETSLVLERAQQVASAPTPADLTPTELQPVEPVAGGGTQESALEVAADLSRRGPQMQSITNTPTAAAPNLSRTSPVRLEGAVGAPVDPSNAVAALGTAPPDLKRSVRSRPAAPAGEVEPVEIAAGPMPEPTDGEAMGVASPEVQIDRQSGGLGSVAVNDAGETETQFALNLPRGEMLDEQLRGGVGGDHPRGSDVGVPLARRFTEAATPAELAEVGGMEEVVAVEGTRESALAGTKVALNRSESSTPLSIEGGVGNEASGPQNPRSPQVDIGRLGRQRVDAPPSVHPLVSRLLRRPARALPVAYADDNVGMRAMFTLRQGDVRRQFIELLGGSDQSERAVQLGLKWLAKYQHTDGHWSLHELNPPDKDLPKVNGGGNEKSDTAATGFALLPFLGAGHSHVKGDFQKTVGDGIRWLVEHQKPDGDLYSGGGGNAHMYSHGIASIALCEAYGISGDPALREPAQQALDFIVRSQHKAGGGWRYQPNQAGDTSVVGWQVMALKSGEMAGLNVPEQTLDLATKWLDSVEGQGGGLGRYGYQGRSGSPAMTAEGLLCRQFLGMRRSDPSMKAGAGYLLEHLPQENQLTSYYWYYGTQVMYHMQGDYWAQWNEHLRDMLIKSQHTSGAHAGTWDPKDQWEKRAGRVYATCMRLLMLEVYYRHLPLYRQLEE